MPLPKSSHLYCGRCAHLISDEKTLSYCPICGVPFSEIPPSQGYQIIHEQKKKSRQRKQRVFSSLKGLGLFLALFILARGLTQFSDLQKIKKRSQSEKLHFYVKNDSRYPKLSSKQIREAIFYSLQSYQDHFHQEILQWELSYNTVPSFLKKHIHNSRFNKKLMRYTFWKEKLNSQPKSWNNTSQELPVLITNIPIYIDKFENKSVETRHLDENGLIGGLGHPSLALVSSYKIHHSLKISSNSESSRYLGEHLIAHELGHSLLGLPDYIRTSSFIRQPSESSKLAHCLMHSYEGDEIKSWKEMNQRSIGEKSSCQEYKNTLQAHQLRKQAHKAFLEGRPKNAILLQKSALALIEVEGQSWLKQLFQEEIDLYHRFL